MANTPFQLDMSPATSTYGELDLTPGLTKVETLAQNKANKLDRLGTQAQSQNLLAGTHSVLDSGTLESNANKIWNELTPEELQYVTGYATSKYYNPELDSAEARRFYTYGTKDDNTKVGLSTGRAPTSDVRYSQEEALKHGLNPDAWRTSGPTGPDLENNLIDTPMDFNAATALEGLYHGNKRLLDERKYKDYLGEEALKAGSGVSEYYKGGAENVFGESYKNLSDERTKELETYFDQMMDLPGAKATKRPRGYRSAADIQGISAMDTDGMIGESVDIAQSSLIQQWGKMGKAVAKMGRWVGESLGVDEETMKSIMPDKSGLFGKKFSELSNAEVSDKMTGVMAKTRQEQQAGMQEALKNIEEGDYGKAAWESVKILPYMLGDSAGEMAAIMSGTPGIALAVSARVSEDSEEYEKNNGVKPDAQWMLGSTLLNAGALLGERFLVKTGINGVIEKGISKAARTGGIATSAVGEATQEYFDQVQQTYMTQKEGEASLGDIATSPEAQLGAVAGGVMGGALRGAGEAGGAALDQAKPVVGKAAGRIADELERRQALKVEEEQAIAEAEAADAPTSLSVKYGDEEAVRTKETEYKTTIDDAIEKGDIYSGAVALKAYSDDLNTDAEGILDKNEFAARKAKLKEMMAAEETKIVEGEASTEQAQTFGSSPDMVDSTMEGKTVEEAEAFLQSYSTNYGSDVDTTRIQQHIVAKKALDEVGEEVAKDIVDKTNAIKNATSKTERAKATADFERFKADRVSRNNKLTNWVSQLEQDLRAEAEAHEDPEAYLRELSKSTDTVLGKANSDHKYQAKGIHTTENYAYRSDIAKRLLNEKHNRGVYNIISNKEAELAAFNSQSELLAPVEKEVPTEEAVEPTKEVDTTPVEEEVVEEVVEPTEEEIAEATPAPTGPEIIAGIAKLVAAKKFDEARAAVETSPLSKDAKKKVLDKIDAQDSQETKEIKPREAKDTMSPGEKITVKTFNEYKDKTVKEVQARHDQLKGKADALSKQEYSEETERKLGLVHNDIQALEDIMIQRDIAFEKQVLPPSQSELERLESLKESLKEDIASNDRESEIIHRLHIASIEANIEGATDSMYRVGEIDSALSDKEIQERLRSVRDNMTKEAFESYKKGLRAGKDATKAPQTHPDGTPDIEEQVVEEMEAETNKSNIVTSDAGTVMLTVPPIKLKNREGFDAKTENHITIIGFKTAKLIKKASKEVQDKIATLVDEFDSTYTLGNTPIEISKEYPETRWTNKEGVEIVNPAVTRGAIIQTATMPGLDALYKEINTLLETNIDTPFPHVTRQVSGHKDGIAVNSEAEFKQLRENVLKQPTKVAPKVEEAPVETLPPVDYGSDFLEVLMAELENDKAEEAELKESLDKSREAIDGFNEMIDQYEKDLQEIHAQKVGLRKKIGKHKEEIKKYKSKIGRAAHKKKLTSSYFNEGLRELSSAKRIAKAAINMMRGMVDSIKRFQKLISKHEDIIEGYNQDMLQLRIREEAIEDAKTETKVEKAETRKQRAEDIDQIQGVQESIKAAEKELQNFVSKEVIRNSSMPVLSQVVFTEKKTAGKLSFDPDAGNQLSIILAGLDESLSAENITRIITEKFNTKGIRYVPDKTIESDPARILFDKEGNLHPNVVAAMSKSLVQYLLKYGTNFLAQDPKQIAQMLGYGDNVESMPAEAIGLVGNKTFKKNVADVLGKDILNDIGLKVDKEADATITKKYGKTRAKDTTGIEEKVIASLGQMAAIVGGEIGIFTKVDDIDPDNQLSAEQYANIAAGVTFEEGVEHIGIDMVGIGELGKSFITSKDMYTTVNEINEEFSEGSYLKEVKTTPIRDKEVVQKVPVQVFEPSEFNKKTINNAREQAWRMDFAALDIFKENEALVKKHLGYVETTEVTDADGNKKQTIPSLAYVDEQNQLAKNNSIDLKLKLLGNLEERIKEQDLDTDLFFEYFYGSNGRYYLDNNEANPQNDKFNRFMLGLASNKVEVDLAKDDKVSKAFYVGLAQSFGEDVDKMSTEKSIEAGKAWLAKGSETILQEFKDEAFEPEEVGHALQGILAVQAFENSNGKAFETNLVIETDAVTSGIILKLLQLPVMGLEKARNLLRKGGIVFKGDKFFDNFEGTNKLIEDGELDLYRELALSYGMSIEDYLSDGGWKIRPKKEGAELTKGQKFINERREKLLNASREGGIMPTFSTKADEITGPLRAIFKPVVMVFGYGGGIESIKAKFVSEIIETLPSKLLAEMEAAQKALKEGKPRPPMPTLDFFKVIAPKQKFTISMLRDQDILDKKVYKNNTIRDLMIQDMTALYGNILERALSDIFGEELVQANKKLNNSFRMMFRIFDHKYKKEIEAFEEVNKRKPTAEEKAEMILELKESFPAVAPPFAKDSEKGIIIDTKTASASRIKAQTIGTFTRDGGQQSLSVQAVVKEFEEAISSGNVVPIHYVDASIIGTTFNNIPDITQVFDALVSNMNNAVDANEEYNKNTYEISKDYSLTKKVLESLQQSIDSMTSEEAEMFLEGARNEDETFAILDGEDTLSFEDVRNQMNALTNKSNDLRKELFSIDAKVDHMTGLSAIAEFKGDTKSVIKKPSAKSKKKEALDADIKQYGESTEPAVETKGENGILPSNKKLNRATKQAIDKECKQ